MALIFFDSFDICYDIQKPEEITHYYMGREWCSKYPGELGKSLDIVWRNAELHVIDKLGSFTGTPGALMERFENIDDVNKISRYVFFPEKFIVENSWGPVEPPTLIDSEEKLIEVFGKPPCDVSGSMSGAINYDINSMYSHVIQVLRVEVEEPLKFTVHKNRDEDMGYKGSDIMDAGFIYCPYVPLQTDDEVIAYYGSQDHEEIEAIEEAIGEEADRSVCEEMPLLCRSQWDSARSWEHTLFGMASDGIQSSWPLNVHSMHAVALRQRLLDGGSESGPEADVQS
jgi:hypothetical protein